MRRICTFLTLATMMMAACTAQECPQCQLKRFYNHYLELSCPPEGELPNYEEAQQWLIRHLTPKLYEAWEASHDAESDEWIDYDMLIQGQDCWPGFHIKEITQIEGTQWYEIVAVQDGSESGAKCVFLHLTREGEQWLVDCIDDGHNRLGEAPAPENEVLKNYPKYQKTMNVK